MNRRIFALVLLLTWPAGGHELNNTVYPAFQWPWGADEILVDGVIDDKAIYPLFEFGHWILSTELRNEEGEAPDPSSLYSEILVLWNDDTNRIYLLEFRYDDHVYQSSDLDGDIFLFKAGLNPEGSATQASFMGVRPDSIYLARQYNWDVKPPYVEMAFSSIDKMWDSYPEATGEDWLYIESSWTLWEEFVYGESDELQSAVEFDLEEGQIIGLAWEYWDLDRSKGPDPEVWYSVGHRPGLTRFENWALSAFRLEPEDGRFIENYFGYHDFGYHDPPDRLPEDDESEDDSAVAGRSWGFVKDLFLNR